MAAMGGLPDRAAVDGNRTNAAESLATARHTPKPGAIFQESKLAHEILDGLNGLELGPAAHNPFGLRTRSVGLTPELDPIDYAIFCQSQMDRCGSIASIDLPGDASALPVPDSTTDFVLHSHVWEHLPNPLRSLEEWVRVVKPGGFIFIIVPKRDAAENDKTRPLTTLSELLEHHRRNTGYSDRVAEMAGPIRGHYTVFSPELLRGIAAWFNQTHSSARLNEIAFQETDDKVGNGHTIVWQVKKLSRNASLARVFKALFR